jgi:hypothetical protein
MAESSTAALPLATAVPKCFFCSCKASVSVAACTKGKLPTSILVMMSVSLDFAIASI